MTCDVAIIGGAFSGASTALLLKRRRPDARVVIIEKAAEFDRKVGESTTEVSSCFLTRVLGLSTYLGHHQLAKQGLRMWFAPGAGRRSSTNASEIGARYNSRLSGFQVDRSTLDEHLLAVAVRGGMRTMASGESSATRAGRRGAQSDRGAGRGRDAHGCAAKWVIDASGRAAVIARQARIISEPHDRASDQRALGDVFAE